MAGTDRAEAPVTPGWEPVSAALVTRSGPSVLDCLEAAMRADPTLTIEEAIRTVPVSEETLRRYPCQP